MFLSDTGVTVAVVGVVVVLVALSTASSLTNPVVDVADEMTTTMSPAEAESAVGGSLRSLPAAEARTVLPGTWMLSYRRHPRYAVILGILTLPLGLLVLLLVRETLQLTITVSAVGDRTRLVVAGRAHQKLAVALGSTLQELLATDRQWL